MDIKNPETMSLAELMDNTLMKDPAAYSVLRLALIKLIKAKQNWPDYVNLHESYGLLREEVKEYETQVFLKQTKRDGEEVKGELADIILVCLRSSGVDILK